MEYLTEDDLKVEGLDSKNLEEMKKIARHNLRYIGPISWLQRKSKVRKYIAKKYKIGYGQKQEDLEEKDKLRLQKESG